MNVLFYHPTSHSDGYPEPPLGIGYLMTVARKHGCHYELYDEDHHRKALSLEQMVRELKPDLCAVSFMTPQFFAAARTIRQLREWLPATKIIVGGPHPSALPQETLAEMEHVDFLARGEGEKTFGEFLDYLAGNRTAESVDGLYYRRDGLPVGNRERALMTKAELDEQQVDWDKLLQYGPFPQKLVYLDTIEPALAVITARGCPYRCTFCDEGSIWRGRTRTRTISDVVAEIKSLRDRFGVVHFNILDDAFALDHRRVKEFCNGVAPLQIHFRITAKVNTITADMLADLERAGCRTVAYGVESGDQAVLDRIRKRQTIADIKHAFQLTHQTGMFSYALCMVGNLGEDMAAVRRTAKLIGEIRPHFFSAAIMTPYPGSENWDICSRNGWILHRNWQYWVPSILKTKDYKPVSRTDVMDEKQVLRAYFFMNRYVLWMRFQRKYGRLFPFRPRFYLQELLPRIRTVGYGSFLRYLAKLSWGGGQPVWSRGKRQES